MRILAVSHPSITDVNQQFYAELELLGHDIKLIVPSNFRHEYSMTPVQVTRWPTFQGVIEQRRVGLSHSIPLHYYQSSLRSTIRNFSPDVLYVEEEPYSLSAWQAMYASRGLKVKRFIYSAQNIAKRYPPPFNWMEKYVLSMADTAVAVSTQVAAVLRDKGFRRKIIPFPLGVDTTQFYPSSEYRKSIRDQLGISEENVIGYVGRFVEEKGIFDILSALPYFEKENLKFLFVGSGPLMGDIKLARAKYPNQVIIADSVEHRKVHRYINAMDALLLPSRTTTNWKEQFGRVIVEALACGVPILGSNSGEIPNILNETGGGWCFAEGNVEQMVNQIYYVLKNEQERSFKALRGSEVVHQKYSKRTLAQFFLKEISM